MNDCYLNFKYEYELLTSYDVDEIIFPRFNSLNNLKNFQNFDCLKDVKDYKKKYDLYNFGIGLLNSFGRDNIACLMFKHVAYIPNGPGLESFINDINKLIETNTEAKVTYFGKIEKSSVSHDLSKEHFAQAKDVVKFHNISSCLNSRYIKKEIVAEEFQRYLAIYFDSRWGKSIIQTDLTETLNHHSCDTFTHGIKFDCPLEFGFASHFRTEIDGFLQPNRIFPFKNVISDIEYSLFLYNILGKN
jgi:hypothetical protein